MMLLIITTTLGAIALLAACVLQFRLKRHVSLEKVHKIDDPKLLYPNIMPPKTVLTERGQYLQTICMRSYAVFVVCVLISAVFAYKMLQEKKSMSHLESIFEDYVRADKEKERCKCD